MVLADNTSCLADDGSFGPTVGADCRDGFDFTWTFEQYLFSIVPSILLLSLAPLRLRILSTRSTLLRGGQWLRGFKLGFIAVFAALQIALIVLWALQPRAGGQPLSVASSSLCFVASLVFVALSYWEHAKSLRPSILLNAYLLLTFVFDAAMLRTLWLTPAHLAIRNLFTASFAIKGLLLLLEAREKSPYFGADDKKRSPEESGGLYSLALFWWLNRIIRQGSRTVLEPEDLYPVTNDMKADLLHAKFQNAWENVPHTSHHRLVRVCISTFQYQLLVPILPRLILIAFTFGQPLLVNRLLNYLQSPEETWNIGYGLIGAYGLVYFGMAVANGFYNYYWFRCLTMLRSFLVTAIFSKTTELSVTALDDSAAVTLMSADVETIVRNLREINELWANPIQIIIATYLLARQLGVACVAPLVIAVMTTGVTVYLAGFTMSLQKSWMAKIQKRIGVTSTMLGHMKSIKLTGLTAQLTKIISNLRRDELGAARKFYLLGTGTATLAYVPILITPLVTFAAYIPIGVSNGNTLDSARLFTALSLITLLSQPLFSVFQDILNLKSSMGCFERIENFLSAETRVESRSLPEIHSSITDSLMLSISEGSFGWKDEPLVKDIDLEIANGSLCLIVGPIGCGKSTLLKSILGETPLFKGVIRLATQSIAWCEQTPWLINTTLQKNIIGYAPLNMDLYNEILHCCDLEADIAAFPQGDQSLIGSKGIVLSGGQKQRVAIARAVYAQRDFAIFDDIFSGLDLATQKNVFNRLFGKQGHFRRRGTTVLLATHAINLVPFADYIVTLGSDGRIVQQGTFEELNINDGYVKDLRLKTADDQASISSSSTRSASQPHKSAATGKKLITNEKARQNGDLSVYHYYFKQLGSTSTMTFLVLQAVWAFFLTFPNVWLEWWASSNESSPNQHNRYYIGVYALLATIGVISTALLTWYCMTVMAIKAGLNLHEVLLNRVMLAPLAFFNGTDVGNITTRFSQDMNLLDRSLSLAVMCTVNYLLICTAQSILIAAASWYIAISFPAIVSIFYFVQKYYLRTSRQLRFMDLEEKAPVYTQFVESLEGLTTIRAFNWQHDALQQNFDLVNRSQKPFYLLFMVQRWLTLVLDLVTTGLAILVVSVAVGLRSSVSVGFTGVSLTQLISFTGYVKMFMLFWTQLETSIGAVSRIKSFDQDVEDENKPGEDQMLPADWPSRGKIEFENVSASYNGETRVLRNISVTIEPGQMVGICGRTGSGKSSIILTLLRMLELSTGSIFIDELDISTAPRGVLRSRLNALAQDPFFLSGTVRLNLDPFDRVSEEEAIAALQRVGLWNIIENKGGLEIDFTEDIFSHGQRQLFCLARALLRPGQIVILDEATSSVDHKTDQLMQQIIRQHFVGRTVIGIAHRLETIIDFDRIMVVEGGTVVEFDSPQALLGRDSKFKELYESSRSTAN